ncbi:MBL fold metallo-hydrolase [Adhaeribacter rhizoryzae]|uniref:MBL fold metallo-hydrolase n=1 Tax=Adhaeribacter rhizoryzae TaxID=2607907 RepID=A0A5M6DGK2_9BACT|nr:MBL fold metallo-hydrolase [Adhaeribacter rhizoryzae]KAA5546641.1 MBL fold metallo-hydrolase [Adhaeribacter rhizoryzae]
MKSIIKVLLYTLAGLIILLVLGGLIFVNSSPQFGGKATGKRLAAIQHSALYEDGRFQNQLETTMDLDFSGYVKVFANMFNKDENQQPNWSIPVQKIDPQAFAAKNDSLTRITWFGHSAFLIEIDGKRLLLDPMLGQAPSPISFVGTQRFSKTLPIAIADLPAIDAILISHDHYDHLDYGSIQQLKEKTGHFYVPLGIGAHLEAWGIPAAKITELEWWQETELQGIKLVSTPARHFSGRGLTDRMQTLWTSWVIQGHQDSIFFSGDSGYFPGFKQIGNKYGPFDITLLECGQYNELWSNIHMMPEETVQAHLDLKGKILMPIHWGAFTLAMHSWTEPVERLQAKAKALQVQVTTPQIGEPIILNQKLPAKRWWQPPAI